MIEDKKLEESLRSLVKEDKPKQVEMSREEEIGFHKGALNTLLAERNELVKMIGNVEAILQMHLKRLEELGIKIK
ncbi:Uncharacterised protein [uncultured archaeon]|nr:Uncharacterised protein [uncultured archaeon]